MTNKTIIRRDEEWLDSIMPPGTRSTYDPTEDRFDVYVDGTPKPFGHVAARLVARRNEKLCLHSVWCESCKSTYVDTLDQYVDQAGAQVCGTCFSAGTGQPSCGCSEHIHCEKHAPSWNGASFAPEPGQQYTGGRCPVHGVPWVRNDTHTGAACPECDPTDCLAYRKAWADALSNSRRADGLTTRARSRGGASGHLDHWFTASDAESALTAPKLPRDEGVRVPTSIPMLPRLDAHNWDHFRALMNAKLGRPGVIPPGTPMTIHHAPCSHGKDRDCADCGRATMQRQLERGASTHQPDPKTGAPCACQFCDACSQGPWETNEADRWLTRRGREHGKIAMGLWALTGGKRSWADDAGMMRREALGR